LNNEYWGLEVDRNNNTVYANTIKDNWGGIRIEEAYNTKIIENNFENDSIYLYCSGNTLITKNNFYQSHASFSNTGYNHIIWIGNYWDKSRLLPKPIIGEIGTLLSGNGYIHRLPWVNFDWFPAQKPYNIGG
jgi:parallel beta-helix repeat protein